MADFKARGAEHLKPTLDSSSESLEELMKFLEREADIRFLEKEVAHSDSHVMNQAAAAMWGALEAFVNDVLIVVLEVDSSRLKSLTPKIKMSAAEFYTMTEQERIETIVELAKQETRSSLKTGAGAFEDLLKAFDLGGGIAAPTARELLELSAFRNCIVHRKGIVDARFKEKCGTVQLKLGESILLTQAHVHRFTYACFQYSSAVLDRIKHAYAPAVRFSALTQTTLENLERLQTSQRAT